MPDAAVVADLVKRRELARDEHPQAPVADTVGV